MKLSASHQEISEAARRLEHAPADEILAWAVAACGGMPIVTSSFADCVLAHLSTSVIPGVEIVFLDTGFHFEETITFMDQARDLLGLNVRVIRSTLAPNDHPCGTDGCCELRKVEPLRQILSESSGWVTGLRRTETPERAGAGVLSFDPKFGVLKVNPLATWSDGEVSAYIRAHGLPLHPLALRGYRSIGCAPTTVPVAPSADARSGRWPGSGKTECGLHL